MEIEKWMKWEPMEGIPEVLYLRELKYDYSGLTLSLCEHDNAPILTIHFNGDLSHRIIDEGDLLAGSKVERDTKVPWTLFTVENSLYLEWFHEQSCHVRENQGLVHYLIATPNEIVDVLDLSSPTIIWN